MYANANNVVSGYWLKSWYRVFLVKDSLGKYENMSDGVFDPSRKIATGAPSKIQDSVLLAAGLGRLGHGQLRDERWPQMKGGLLIC